MLGRNDSTELHHLQNLHGSQTFTAMRHAPQSFITFKTYMVLKPAVMLLSPTDCFITFKTYMVLKPAFVMLFSSSASSPSKLTWFSNGEPAVFRRQWLHHLQNLHGSQTLSLIISVNLLLHHLQNLHGSQTYTCLYCSGCRLHHLQNLHGSQTVSEIICGRRSFITFKTYMVLKQIVRAVASAMGFITFKTYMVLKQSQIL